MLINQFRIRLFELVYNRRGQCSLCGSEIELAAKAVAHGCSQVIRYIGDNSRSEGYYRLRFPRIEDSEVRARLHSYSTQHLEVILEDAYAELSDDALNVQFNCDDGSRIECSLWFDAD